MLVILEPQFEDRFSNFSMHETFTHSLLIAAFQEILGSGLKPLFAQHGKAKCISQAICRVERKTDCQRIFNLARRDSGREDRAHVCRTDFMLASKLAIRSQGSI